MLQGDKTNVIKNGYVSGPLLIFHQLILSYWSSGSICIPIGALLNAAIVIFVLVPM